MFQSYGKRILRGFSYRLMPRRGKYAAIALVVNFTFCMMWWAILAAFWLCWAMLYVVFYLPYKGIKKLLKR